MAENESRIDRQKVEAFLDAGASFFSWNSGKNTPNILLMLHKSVESLQKSMDKAAESSERAAASSDKLAKALNWLTGAGVVVGILNILAGFLRSRAACAMSDDRASVVFALGGFHPAGRQT
jgi:hypothetical protein